MPMSTTPDATVLIGMAGIAVQGMPEDWIHAGPVLGLLLDQADLPLCAAPDPAAARALAALGARLPVASAPEECAPASVGLLALQSPETFAPGWRGVLAPGALVVTRNAQGPVLEEDGALHVHLGIEAGISVDLRAGGHAAAVRGLLEACAGRQDLCAAIEAMSLVLASKHAHLNLAATPPRTAAPARQDAVDPAPGPWIVRLGRRMRARRRP